MTSELRERVDGVLGSFASAELALLQLGTSNGDLRKQFVMDSFHVNRFHKSYRAWDNIRREEFIDKEIASYNQKLGVVTRLNYETEKLVREYGKASDTIKLPEFSFSIHTIKQYDEGRLLQELGIDESVLLVDINQLFSLELGGALPNPDLKVIQDLLNIEFRLRIERKIKYELLLLVKQLLTSKNKKWAVRDQSLNEFMRKLAGVTEEVESIRKSEKEDLGWADEEFLDEDMDEEDEDDDDDRQDAEEEEAVEEELEGEGAVEDSNDMQIEDSTKVVEESQPEDAATIEESESVTPFEASPSPAVTDLNKEQPSLHDLDDDIMNIDG